MQHWGFVKVYEGKSYDNLKDFTPQNGDIAVVAGKDFDTYHNIGASHGHIHIYYKPENSKNGRWCSDYRGITVWAYPDKERPYYIFRHKSLFGNV